MTMVIIQILDRLLILVSLYFLYILLFHLPRQCDVPPLPPTPPSYTTPTYPSPNHQEPLCPNDADADKIMKDFLERQYANLDRIKQDGRFIVYSATDSAGFGNRIPALISSFVMALIMERGFLVHWPEVSQRNIQDQLDESSVVMPVFGDLFMPPVPIDMLSVPSYYSFLDDMTAVPIKLDESADGLLCTDLISEHRARQFVVIRGYRPFFDLLTHNTHLLPRLLALGLTPHRIHQLAECLLRPVPAVLALVRQFREENAITSKHQLVGVHIRKQSQHGLTVAEQAGLWSCVRKKYPPPYEWSDGQWDEKAEKNGKEIQDQEKRQKATTLYFLASDSDTTLDLVPLEFQPYVVKLSGKSSRNTTTGILRALADIWILGHSVEVFGAQGTTFLSAVRTLFPSKANLAVVGGKQVDSYCRGVAELPCYKWWDIFKSKDVPDFKLSCFSANATAKHIIVC